jgi:hypothetical protein
MQIRMTAIASLVAASFSAGAGAASAHGLTDVPNANPKSPGVTSATVLSPELVQIVRAQGSMPVENPTEIKDKTFKAQYYGYLSDQPNLLPAIGSNVEASKTEPDKNTYLVLRGLTGADPAYDYGTHFLFQGHETGAGYITRINLDADAAHRVTVLATVDTDGNAVPTIDGSTWYPWSQQLLFTQEGDGSTSGGIWQATPNYPSTVVNLQGVIGRGGYEGVQADSDGNIWIVEDIGGSTVGGAKLPNSFVYRFIPKNKYDLTQGGKLQALQVMSKANPGQPIKFDSGSALTQDVLDLHTCGNVFDTTWVTIHDTDVDGQGAFNANQLAKDKLATPFKRPENGQFRPGSYFREFFFDETGDTSATSKANTDPQTKANYGGWGSVMKLAQHGPSSNSGKLTMFYPGDQAHSGFDNVAFWGENTIVFVEDAGDTLHTQRNALDSAYLFDVRKNYCTTGNQPIRIMAEGRDPSATIDSGLSGSSGFRNEGDNEITGIHVSDGDAGRDGLLGAKIPRPFRDGWRVFYTQQHGDNVTYEIIRNPSSDEGLYDDDYRR